MDRDCPKISLYNTHTRKIESFKSICAGEVKLYCCGPTVYDFQHIGNLRTYIFEDILVRVLRYAGYNVNHVMNITDVGHLVSDADEGEDKMLLAMRREKKRSCDIAKYYTDIFFEHCKLLNIKRPNIACNATEHIEHMIALIAKLLDRGYAYLSGGNVYFDVAQFPRYGDLALLPLDNLKSGARIDIDDKKKNSVDFALWFTKSKFENQELVWSSPWGIGYPGWHIECSAMAMHYLGSQIDIHCGGIDHIPVHHTNEIAQSECATGCKFVNFWIHGGWLTNDKEKMSKSSGGFVTLSDLIERNINPLAYRYMCLTALYRRELSWSWDSIGSATSSYNKLKSSIQQLKEQVKLEKYQENLICDVTVLTKPASDYLKLFEEAIFSDLNMPKSLAVVYSTIGSDSISAGDKLFLLARYDEILGLDISEMIKQEASIPAEVLALNAERDIARKEKRWQDADTLRSRIAEFGFLVMDSSSGGVLRKKDS